MFVLGEAVDGPTAVAWGIANALVAPDSIRPRAPAPLPRRSPRVRESVRQTRRLLRNADALAARIAEENEIFAAQLRSAEAREAFAAFREKRPADFSRVR